MASGVIDPLITADDVIRAGACRDGVYKRAEKLAGKIAAAEPLSRLLKLLPPGERDYALAAAGQSSDGDVALTRLVGMDLQCWCPLTSHWCHAEILLAHVRAIAGENAA